MANEITKVAVKPVTPAAMGFTDRAQAAVDLEAGDLVIFNGTTPANRHEKVAAKAPTTGITEAHAIVAKDCPAGRSVSLFTIGEFDGYSGLTPGAPLYPSVAVAGQITTDAIVGATVRIRAVTPTRIRVNFV